MATERLPVVYIIGPFRGKSPWEVAQNVRHAEEVALAVAEMGAMPLCPHTNTAHFDGLLTAEFWLAGTSELLRRCDAAVTVGGWMYSNGSLSEVALAGEIGIPVFHDHVSLAGWVAERIEMQSRALRDAAERMRT
jgi:hypothetical protein